MKLDSLEKLYVHELKDLYSAENQLIEALPKMRDAALIAASQRIEHYEMAGYGTARTYAERLGHQDAADTLQITLNEEGHANQKLTRLAERKINFLALGAIG